MTVYADETPTRDRVTTLAGTVWQATFAEDASAVGEPARVTIAAWPGAETWGPCTWSPYDLVSVVEDHGVVSWTWRLPRAGDSCLVVFDDAEAPWVIAWRPA